MKFYEFRQNKSFGRWLAPAPYVYIEAASAEEANVEAIARTEGDIYFDGCERGEDCTCCGDRWSRVDESRAEAVAVIRAPPTSILSRGSRRRIYFANGHVEEYCEDPPTPADWEAEKARLRARVDS